MASREQVELAKAGENILIHAEAQDLTLPFVIEVINLMLLGAKSIELVGSYPEPNERNIKNFTARLSVLDPVLKTEVFERLNYLRIKNK